MPVLNRQIKLSVPKGSKTFRKEKKLDTQLPDLKPKNLRLVLGLVKVGKTYTELERLLLTRKGHLSVVITMTLTSTRDQTIAQAVEAGWDEADVKTKDDLKACGGYSELDGKLYVINLHQSYNAKLGLLLARAHRQGLKIDFILDEYDLVAPFFRMKQYMAHWETVTEWLQALETEDTLTFISATNVIAYLSDVTFSSIHQVKPYKDSYYGYNDLIIETISDLEAEELEDGKMPIAFISRILDENSRKRKALIKVTNNVEEKENYISQNKLLKTLKDANIPCVAINSKTPFNQETYDEAVVVITGMMGNRTAWFPDITVQYYSFGGGAVVSTIIQGLRACGYREYQPTVRIPTKLHKKLMEAIALENKLYSDLESWTDKNRGKYGLVVPKSQKIIQSKVANVVIEPFVTGIDGIIDIEEHTGYLAQLYPLVDELSHNQLEGTREYQGRTPYVIYRDTMNVFSKTRLQESRRMFVPKKDWTFPKYGELGSTIRMCSKFNYDMKKCATYYLDLETCELKIALWDVEECFEGEERIRIYVKTESGQET